MPNVENLLILWKYYNSIEWDRIADDENLEKLYDQLVLDKINKLFSGIDQSTYNVINACLIAESFTEYFTSVLVHCNSELTFTYNKKI